MSIRVYGSITRDLYEFWYARVGSTIYIPGEQLHHLFNDMDLFPSKSQVYEMLQCACECSNRNPAAYLTFGEFCVFAADLKKCYGRESIHPVQMSKLPEKNGISHKKRCDRTLKTSSKYEVFLGGSCNPTTWRQDIAIPMLKGLGITYYNPQVSHWGPELIERENQAKLNATVLFFVIDNQTRSIASIIEVAHSSGQQRKLILVVNGYSGPGQKIMNESLSNDEYEDLTNGQMILQDLVERQGIPVFENISIALNCTAKVLRENISVQELELTDFAQPVKMAHVQLGDKLLKLRETFDALNTTNSGEISLPDVCMAFRIMTNRDLTMEELKSIVSVHKGKSSEIRDIPSENIHVNFEEFCCIMAEFPNHNCQNKRLWDIVADKTIAIVHTVLCPVAKVLEWVISPSTRPRLLRLPSSNGQITRNVYLGGSCGSTMWREAVAIPILKKNGLTYFNPQSGLWMKRLIPLEVSSMDNSQVLLFVITNCTRALSSMAIAAHYIGLRCNVVLCIQYLPEMCVIGNEKLSENAIKDYNRGRIYLSDLANRDGIPVFENIEEAVDCVVAKCRGHA